MLATSSLRYCSESDGNLSSEAESIDGMIPAYNNKADDKARDAILIEYLAGWAMAQSDCHRQFVAITPFHN